LGEYTEEVISRELVIDEINQEMTAGNQGMELGINEKSIEKTAGNQGMELSE